MIVGHEEAGDAEIMKEQKSLTPNPGDNGQPRAAAGDNGSGEPEKRPKASGSVEHFPVRQASNMQSGPSEAPVRPGSMTQNEVHPHKRRGRLGRDVQAKLGQTLRAYFDDVVKEGVPDGFRALRQQYDDRKDKGSS